MVVRDADGVFHPTLTTAANEREARFSPNGQWFAYRSNETGRDEVYVQSYPPGNGKWQISTDGGAQAMWAPNGRELFFLNGNRMMVVDVELRLYVQGRHAAGVVRDAAGAKRLPTTRRATR